MRSISLGVLGIIVLAAALPAQQRRTCVLVLDKADRHGTQSELLPGNTNYDVAGDVHFHCDKQKVFADNGFAQRAQRSTSRGCSGTRSTRTAPIGWPQTRSSTSHAPKRSRDAGTSTCSTGAPGPRSSVPYVDYWRQVKGINDSAKVVALMRPTVRYFLRAAPKDTASEQPYILSGQMLQGFGGSRLWGSGAVTIDRDSLHGDGDSLAFERGATSVGQLIGAPATLRRTGSDSFKVSGA